MKKLLLLALILTAACSSTKSHKSPSFTYPAGLETLGNQARLEAKTCLDGVTGRSFDFKKSVVVERRSGEQKKSGEWMWREPKWNNAWVTGLTWDKGSYYLLQVAANPKNGSEVSYGVLKHEHGHYLLMSNLGDATHNPKYKGCFLRWYGTGGALSHEEGEIDGEKVVVDVYTGEE